MDGKCPECMNNLIHPPFGSCEMCQIVGAYHQYEIFEPEGELTVNEMNRCEKELKEFKKTLTNRDVFLLNLWYWYSLTVDEVKEACIV